MSQTYKLCPACGYFVQHEKNHRFCISCGTKLLSVCPECEAPITSPVARFCPSCGGQLVMAVEGEKIVRHPRYYDS